MYGHITYGIGLWEFEVYPTGIMKDHVKELDKLHEEQKTNGNRTIHPIQKQIGVNILTTAGLTEMAKRNAGLSTSTNTHQAIGVGTNEESKANTALQDEKARKAIASTTTNGTTEKYRTAFTNSDITASSEDIIEAGLFTASSGGIMMARITNQNAVTLNSTTTLTITTQINWV